jgi:hypothetical protein
MTTTDTRTDTDTRLDTGDIVFTDIVVSNPARSDGGNTHRRLTNASKIVLIAGGAVALVASALLVQRTTSDPGPTPVPGAISPSDANLGYLLSDAFPEISSSPPVLTPSPADLTLGYLLSEEFPILTPSRDRTQDPLAFLFSEDFPDVGG